MISKKLNFLNLNTVKFKFSFYTDNNLYDCFKNISVLFNSDMLLKRLREYTEGKIQLRLETMRVNYKDLIADPEFTLEYLQDPIKYRKYQIFQSIKMSYMKPVAVILLYIFEKKLNFPIEDIYFHDLIGGEPAYPQGISGRGIDYVMIFKKMPDINLVKEVEQFIDDLIGAAITNYFWKKSLCDCNIPFNKIIKHNLIGIIPILSLQKANYGLEGGFFTPPVKKQIYQSIEKD